jgi:hypothetical protein
MVMKNKLFITGLFLIVGSQAFAQTDTLSVYLEKNQDIKYGIDLVFENNSNDTIFLFSKFHNFSLEGSMAPGSSGIYIYFYYDGNEYAPTWGEMPIDRFVYSRGFTLINPKSKIKLPFNMEEFFYLPDNSSSEVEVGFIINYSYSKYLKPNTSAHIIYFKTNRIKLYNSDKIRE